MSTPNTCPGSHERVSARDTFNRRGTPVANVECESCGRTFVARTRSHRHYGDKGLAAITYSAVLPRHNAR